MTLPGSPGWRRFLRVAAARGAAPAFIADGGNTSFATLAAMAAGWAGQHASIAPGDRVVIWSRNSVPMAAAILGTWARGAIPVLVGAQAPPRHIRHAAEHCDAVAVAAEDEAAAAAITGRPVLALDAGRIAPPVPGTAGHGGEPASILFTSGSSGLPKGVAQAHRTLQAGCDAVAVSIGLADDDRLLCGVPWAFDYGWGQLLFTFLRGMTQILPATPDPLAVCAAIGRHRPTVLASVPALLAGMTHGVSGIASTDLSSVRLVTNTGSRIPPSVLKEAWHWFAHAEFSLNYGLTETYRTASLPAALARIHPDSVGRAIPGVAIAVVDEDGKAVPPGTLGEVVHRGDGVFMGYWGDEAATAKVRRPDPLWHGGVAAPPAVFTGDLGLIDAEGLLHLAGRRDRQVKSMGVRVSPEEIEAILLDSTLVREAAVIAVPHATAGDRLVAIVVPTAPETDVLAALKRHARQEMSAFMQPRHYELAVSLPRTTSGKIDYPSLRARFAEGVQGV